MLLLFESLFRRFSFLNVYLSLFADFKCSVCQKGYSSKSSLAVHEKTHQVEEQNKCTICKKEFKYESAFKRHMETKHSL